MLEPNSKQTYRPTRRQVLAGTGALLGTVGGGSILLTRSDEAAAISVDTFSVSDATFEAENVTPEAVVDVAWEYQVAEAPEEVRLKLLVGETVVEQKYISVSNTTDSGTVRMTGLVLDSGSWSEADFTVEPGEEVSRVIDVGVSMAVRGGGSVLAEASASDSSEVVLAHPEDTTVIASVGGSGEIIE